MRRITFSHSNRSDLRILSAVMSHAFVATSMFGLLVATACSSSRAPVNTFEDGPVATTPIFASESGSSVAVTVPPYSVVVVAFPKR
jgi:hypothetical protein